MFCCQRHTPDFYPINYCAGGMVGHRAAMYGCGKLRPRPGMVPRTVHPATSRYTDYYLFNNTPAYFHTKCVWAPSYSKQCC